MQIHALYACSAHFGRLARGKTLKRHRLERDVASLSLPFLITCPNNLQLSHSCRNFPHVNSLSMTVANVSSIGIDTNDLRETPSGGHKPKVIWNGVWSETDAFERPQHAV